MHSVGLRDGFAWAISHKSVHVRTSGAMSDSLYMQSHAITTSILTSFISLLSFSTAGREQAESVSQSIAKNLRFLGPLIFADAGLFLTKDVCFFDGWLSDELFSMFSFSNLST